MGSGARFRVGIALSAIGEGLREAARDFGGASLRCVCLPLSPAGSGHPPHRFITPSSAPTRRSTSTAIAIDKMPPTPKKVLLERVMNSIRNGLGMRETEIAREPS